MPRHLVFVRSAQDEASIGLHTDKGAVNRLKGMYSSGEAHRDEEPENLES
jgi:hypothetical protein